MADCPSCTAPIPDAGVLCQHCTRRIGSELADVPALCDELEVTRTRQDKIMLNSNGGRSAEKPLYWNEHAAGVAWELNCTLNAWALDVSRLDQDERDLLADVDAHNTSDLARWLGRNLHTLRMHTDAQQAHDELIDAVRRARRAIDRPDTRTRFFVGPCPEEIDTAPCTGEVWAFIPTSEDVPAQLRCQECGSHWDTTQWLRVGKRILWLRDQQRRIA